MPKGYGTRANAIVEARRLRVSELYLTGSTQPQIAVLMTVEFPNPSGKPVSQQTISRDLKAIRLQWRTSAMRNFDEAKALELARVDQVELEAWEAWKRSIGTHAIETRKNTFLKSINLESNLETDLPAEEVTLKREKLAGDPRFLEVVMKCVQRRCEILGLDAPKKIGNPDGTSLLIGIKVEYV